MKKSNLEIALEAFKYFLKYLDNHKIQARIIIAALCFYIVAKSCSNEIAILIQAFK